MKQISVMRVPLPVLIVAVILVSSCTAELCPDHKQLCRSGQTCCDNKQGGYGCCPYANATCCTDGRHCCPSGTYCDLSAGRCKRNNALRQFMLDLDVNPDNDDRDDDQNALY